MPDGYGEGWVLDQDHSDEVNDAVQGYGASVQSLPFDPDKDALIYRFLAEELQGSKWVKDGVLQSQNQRSIGSCVGHGTSVASDLTAACDIHIRKEPEVWVTLNGVPVRSCPIAGYVGARQIVNSLGRSEGACGSYAARARREYGNLFQMPYDEVDLTDYTVDKCRRYQIKGFPTSLIEKMKPHQFQTCWRVKSAEQAAAFIQNGYGINQCCGLGWSKTRSEGGWSRQTGKWAHSMAIIGYRGGKRRGFLIVNSWGNGWIRGPVWPEDQPKGSYWADWKDVDRAMRTGDCWAYGGYAGVFVPAPNYDELGSGW